MLSINISENVAITKMISFITNFNINFIPKKSNLGTHFVEIKVNSL